MAPIRFGPYQVYETLGRGGMCQVFRARHDRASADCALKLLREDQSHDPQLLDMFTSEADLSMLLDHPNLVRTHDAGEIAGRLYIAMELIPGATLSQLVSRLRKAGLRLPPDFALYILSEVLEGLHALHIATGHTGRALGLIHRDVTPQNIFLCFDGRVILGDFGVVLVKAYGDSEPGLVMGKPGYIAPEMLAMEEVDRRADIFSAGVVLYELLTGGRAFEGPEHAVMSAVLEVRIPRPARVNRSIGLALDEVIMRALARKPKDRYSTADELLYALQPHWSKTAANPYALAALMSAMLGPEAERWREAVVERRAPSRSRSQQDG